MSDANTAVLAEAREALTRGRPARALRKLRPLLGVEPALPEALRLGFDAALATSQPGDALQCAARLQMSGAVEQALECYDALLAAGAQSPFLHYNRGSALKQLRHLPAAIDAYHAALALAPDEPDLHVAIGIAQAESGNFATAIEHLEQVVRAQPDNPAALEYLSYSHGKEAHGAQARTAAERLCTLFPDSTETLSVLLNALLVEGDALAARDASAELLQRDPGSRVALAGRAMALTALGQTEEAQQITDFDRLTARMALPVPDGYGSVGAFNAALIEHVRSHHGIRQAANSLSCHQGDTTGEILLAPLGPLADFERVIRDAATGHLDAVAGGGAHPWLDARTANLNMTAWMTTLLSEGYQHGHIHARGLLSGVYYLRLPMDADAGDDGCIEFGRAPEFYGLPAQFEPRVIKPAEGVMLLFPSYFYHRTVPFSASSERVTIAFDFEPVSA